MQNKKNRFSSKINRVLEVPRELSKDETKITIVGFDEMVVENYKGILEYEDYYIKLSTYIGTININGLGLNLDKMTEDCLKITGKIESLDIERQVEWSKCMSFVFKILHKKR